MSFLTSAGNLIGTFIFKFVGFMIRSLYNLIVMLADVNILENSNFNNMKRNVFGLIGLFMVFKLAFSIIQYITNPDKLTDKSSGAGNILKKVVVVLILLGTINTIFEKVFELQGLILQDAVLERLVFGTKNKEQAIDPEIGIGIKTSDYLAYSILAPFVTFNTESNIWGDDVDENALEDCDEFIKATDPDEKDICHSTCASVIQNEDEDAYDAMCKGLEERNMYKSLIDVLGIKIDKTPVIIVDWLFGGLIGVVCIVVLVIIAVGVAIRSVKLSFLQLIAPLPIISYIDPKDNANGMFNKWVKETIKTFLELFIRLLAFYFAILIITKVLTASGGVAGYSGTTYTFKKYPLVIIFLIIGCFLFALQLPKLIENLFGSLGGFSRDAKSTGALAAGLGGIAGGIIGGTVGNAIGTAKQWKDDHNGKLGVGGLVRSGIAGVTGAVGTGLGATTGALKGFKKSGEGLSGGKWTDISKNAIARTGALRNARAVRYDTASGKTHSGYNISGPLRKTYGKFAEMAGIKDDFSATGRKKATVKGLENELRKYQNNLSKASSDRMAALQQYNAASQERQTLASNPQKFDEHMFDELGGSYDSALKDFTFNTKKGIKTLSQLDHTEFESLYNSNRGGITDPTALAEYDKKFKGYVTNNSTLQMLRDKVSHEMTIAEEYNAKLAAAQSQESYWQGQYQAKDADYNEYQTTINNINKELAKANRQVETLNKAYKK